MDKGFLFATKQLLLIYFGLALVLQYQGGCK